MPYFAKHIPSIGFNGIKARLIYGLHGTLVRTICHLGQIHLRFASAKRIMILNFRFLRFVDAIFS